eukprot:12717325-Prorocentrum_lima.AAC.1
MCIRDSLYGAQFGNEDDKTPVQARSRFQKVPIWVPTSQSHTGNCLHIVLHLVARSPRPLGEEAEPNA